MREKMIKISKRLLICVVVSASFMSIPVTAQKIISEESAYTVTQLPDVYIGSEMEVNEAEIVSSTNVIGSSVYFLTADDVTSGGLGKIASQLTTLKVAGYPYMNYQLSKTAAEIVDILPNYDIAILHGHGLAGLLTVLTDASQSSTLYSSTTATIGSDDAELAELGSGDISAKIVIFTSCLSGVVDSAYTPSLAGTAYAKGADVTLGYLINVTRAEWYSAYVIESMADGNTFGQALEDADVVFNSTFPSILTEKNPGLEENRRVYGSTDVTL